MEDLSTRRQVSIFERIPRRRDLRGTTTRIRGESKRRSSAKAKEGTIWIEAGTESMV